MKKSYFICAMCISSVMLAGCSRTARDVVNMQKMVNGQVVEVEGPEDQYGWMPHLRLTYQDGIISEVYFDYINEDSEKKSQKAEYNSTMQEKTGTKVEDAMRDLRNQLLNTQNASEIKIVAGATQTSKEFAEMASKAMTNYNNGLTAANNYGEGDEIAAAVARGAAAANELLETASLSADKFVNTSSSSASHSSLAAAQAYAWENSAWTDSSSKSNSSSSSDSSASQESSPYVNGGDANPNYIAMLDNEQKSS
ncbi:MAG: hypothetical protein ATN34_03770 [Epulopiscium sp. Nele67-Bin002]|nr:MAG: hypothetical protein ATN34_03770 [Epulopiscium sp. Nele67-Bin002]OON91960.1 MAG: hypothetical protein ATN33_08210 [Epulopiscium sp. Nele67-Bin001]